MYERWDEYSTIRAKLWHTQLSKWWSLSHAIQVQPLATLEWLRRGGEWRFYWKGQTLSTFMTLLKSSEKRMYENEGCGTDLTVSVRIHICHNTGTHLGNLFYGREQILQQISSGESKIFCNMWTWGSEFCVTGLQAEQWTSTIDSAGFTGTNRNALRYLSYQQIYKPQCLYYTIIYVYVIAELTHYSELFDFSSNM